MVLGDVEESVYIVEEDENEEETVRVCRMSLEMDINMEVDMRLTISIV